jgi:hypothetical protein
VLVVRPLLEKCAALGESTLSHLRRPLCREVFEANDGLRAVIFRNLEQLAACGLDEGEKDGRMARTTTIRDHFGHHVLGQLVSVEGNDVSGNQLFEIHFFAQAEFDQGLAHGYPRVEFVEPVDE